MKIIFIIFTILTFSLFLLGQTQVSGNQSGEWTTDNSPYLVVGDVTVPSGNTLNIQAGVTVKFDGYYKIRVVGNLNANGTEADSVLFTTDNQTVGWSGIQVESSLSHFSYCRFEYGKTSGNYPNNNGGAIRLISANAVISNCLFYHNNAPGDDDGMGGAIYGTSTGSATKIENCTFIGNYAYGEGGAIKLSNSNNTQITECEFYNNNCLYGGGAVAFYSVVNNTVTKCLFANNYTVYGGGGAIEVMGMGNTIDFKNCTLYGNEAQNGDGGAMDLSYADISIVNSIIYNNPGQYSDGVYVNFGSDVQINYSDLTMPSDATGTHNMNQNPMFVDVNNADFHLSENSPCIDAGTDVGLPYYGESPDMGCFEWHSENAADNQISQNKIMLKNYPNPFNLKANSKQKLQIFYDIPQSANIKIDIYDLKGRHIKNLKNGFERSGSHTIVWDAKNSCGKKVSSGVYFYGLQMNGKTKKTGKITFTR